MNGNDISGGCVGNGLLGAGLGGSLGLWDGGGLGGSLGLWVAGLGGSLGLLDGGTAPFPPGMQLFAPEAAWRAAPLCLELFNINFGPNSCASVG